VSEHVGGLGGGHYTAHCLVRKDDGDSAWYSFNDSSVRKSSIADAHSDSAYVLFYERVGEVDVTGGRGSMAGSPSSSSSDDDEEEEDE
jgi:hypothetical protein